MSEIENYRRHAILTILDTWGYTIWRTVFTPGSDETFARALEVINQYVKAECFQEVEEVPSLAYASQELWQRFGTEIIEDRDLDGASSTTVRLRFKSWIEARGEKETETSRYRYCIMMDAEAVEALNRLPMPPKIDADPEHIVRIVDVEKEHDLDVFPQAYRCCTMTPPWYLANVYFWGHNLDPDELRDGRDGTYRDIPIYAFSF